MPVPSHESVPPGPIGRVEDITRIAAIYSPAGGGRRVTKQVGKLSLTFFPGLEFRTLEICLRLAPVVEGSIPSAFV